MPFIPDDPNLHAVQRGKPAATMPATFGEFAGAAANAFLATERSISKPYLTAEVHEEVMSAYQRETGQQFRWKNERGYMTDGAPAFRGGVRRFWSAMAEEIRKNPQLRESLPFTSAEGVDQRMRERAGGLEGQRLEVGSRAQGLAQLGQFAGDLAAMATDPPVAASFFLGAPMAARTTILRGAATEATIGAASEGVVQVYASEFRDELDLDGSLQRALTSVGIVAAGAGGIYAAGSILARFLRGSKQQTAMDQVVKEQHLADNRPQGMSDADHRRAVDQAIYDLEEGRAVNVERIPEMQGSKYLIDMQSLGRRLQSVERQGVPVSDLIPNLGRAMNLAADGARIAFSRQRVDGLASRAARARQGLKPVYERAAEAERRYAELAEQRADITTQQIRTEQFRGGRANAEQALHRSTRQRLADIEAEMQQLREGGARAEQGGRLGELVTERRRIVDAARKRVEREAARLDAEAQRLDIEIAAQEIARGRAMTAVQAAEREISEAEGAIAREIGGALTDKDIRRLYEERKNGVVPAGKMPVGQAGRVADAERAVQELEAELDGSAAEQIRAARDAASQDVADELGEDVMIDVDGEMVPANQAYARIAQKEADEAELERCILGG